jgi:hypothetical protein
MGRWFRTGMVLALGLALEGAPGWGQVVERERDVTITGPRGKSINRSITSERGPGFVDRQVNIQRPGGTFHSNAFAGRVPGPGPRPGPGFFGPAWRPGPGGWGWGPREVIINNGGGPGSWLAPLAVGGGLFGLGMFAGSALSQPAPVPVQPVYTAPPTQVYVPPQPYGAVAAQPQPAPVQGPTVVIDPVADAIGRLQSHHANSRRDGAYTLGRLRDPRAIPALVDRLKNDGDPDVRIASATALGEIGDPRVAVYLERVTLYDKKQKVRDAAALALGRLPREVPPPQGGQPLTPVAAPAPGSVPVPNLAPIPSNVQPGTSAPAEPVAIERVPPPPTPAYPGPGSGANNP